MARFPHLIITLDGLGTKLLCWGRIWSPTSSKSSLHVPSVAARPTHILPWGNPRLAASYALKAIIIYTLYMAAAPRDDDPWALPIRPPGMQRAPPGHYRDFARTFINNSRRIVVTWLNDPAGRNVPRAVQGALQRIADSVTFPALKQTIIDGYHTATPKVVCLWLHTNGSPMQYVGSAWTGLLDRTTSHFNSASHLAALPRDYHHQQSDCPYQLYVSFSKHGLKKMIVVPVKVMPANTTKRQLQIEEQYWIDDLKTLTPSGYNHKRACASPPPRAPVLCFTACMVLGIWHVA